MATGTQVKKRMETRMKIGPCMGSYVNLFTPRAFSEKSEPKYSVSILFDKKANPNSPEGKSFAELNALLKRIAVLKFGPDYESIAGFKWPIRDGDVEKPTLPEYVGKWFISASGKRQPGIIDRHLKPVTSESECYSGCKFVFSVNAFAFTTGSKGVALGLNNVLVFEKGTRIDGRKEAAEDFAEYAGEENGGSSGTENPLD